MKSNPGPGKNPQKPYSVRLTKEKRRKKGSYSFPSLYSRAPNWNGAK
jgi:hypothetical protein